MKLSCCCVFDAKTMVFAVPFFVVARAAAVRAFAHTANDPDSQVCRHAEDFTLFELGEFNDETGFLCHHAQQVNLGTALSFKREVSNVRK